LRGAGERDAVAVGGDDVDAALLLQGLVDVQLAGEELQGQDNLAGLETKSPRRGARRLLPASRLTRAFCSSGGEQGSLLAWRRALIFSKNSSTVTLNSGTAMKDVTAQQQGH
jgi:hypothetical protein